MELGHHQQLLVHTAQVGFLNRQFLLLDSLNRENRSPLFDFQGVVSVDGLVVSFLSGYFLRHLHVLGEVLLFSDRRELH